MTKIKNGRLLLTMPAIIGMAVCIADMHLAVLPDARGTVPCPTLYICGGVHTGSAQHVFLALHGRL